MSNGAVIENLSNRKLFTILAALTLLQLLFFVLGALYAPNPSTSMEFLMTKCRDPSAGHSEEFFYLRPPKHCDIIENLDHYRPISPDVRDIVFVAQMPHMREGVELEYSPWFQYLLGFLDVEMEYSPQQYNQRKMLLELEVRMGYKRGKADAEWTELISTSIEREIECTIDENKRQTGRLYNCTTLDLFELGASNYPFYVLNLRLPVNKSLCASRPRGPNCQLGIVHELRLIAVHQTGGFTWVWLWLKTLMAPVVIAATMWYSRRVDALNRPKLLVEKAILVLGWTMALLDFPTEWLSLWIHLPALLLLNDIRQGVFYAVLFSFWLIFAGEHLIDDRTRNNLTNYWRNLSLVGSSAIALLCYDLAGRGRQLLNPFHSVWASPVQAYWARLTLNVAGGAALVYFVFLCYKIWMVWATIKRKRSAQLYRASENRRLKVEGIIYRFKFLMLLTAACSASTIISYYMQQYHEMHPLEDAEDEETARNSVGAEVFTHSASAFFTGTFGMWNLYVLLLLSMYAPSHKYYAQASRVMEDENEDLMDPMCSSTEAAATAVEDMTPMSTFFLKQATD